jgi:uncharacterized protein
MITEEIRELANRFVSELSPLKVYLFGSFAEGRENENSDYDFYIVVSDSEKDMIEVTVKAYRAIRYMSSRPVDIIVNTDRAFKERKADVSSLEYEVERRGILLSGE